MAHVRALTIQQERGFMQHCNMQLAFTVWWRTGKIVTSLDQSQKEKWTVVSKNGSKEASHGVVCGSKHISVYEMWKMQQTHEHARTM